METSARSALTLRSDEAGAGLQGGDQLASGASSRLFGRLQESASLADAYARVSSTGASEIVLLSGPPGIGKSALVHRFQSLLRVGRHRFTEGKSEHSQNGAALAPVTQALRFLVDAILGESDEALAGLRGRLQAHVGNRGRLINDLLPEAEALIGRAAPLPELPAALAQTRMQRTLIAAFGAFAETGQPLVLFIDDLQWADAATIAMLAAFANDPPANMLLAASYRDEGAEALEAPGGLVTTLREAGIRVTEISVSPLSLSATGEIVAQALKAKQTEVAPLVDAIHAKARGNPFFIEHFLRLLLEEDILCREAGSERWIWDDRKLARVTGGGNVLDFIAGRLARLEPAHRDVMASLASLGGRTDASIIASLLGWKTSEVEKAAAELMSLGLLRSEGSAYSFPHDRIHEAADLLTPASARPAIHARIARLLLAKRRFQTPDQVFAVAGHVLRAAGSYTLTLLKPRQWLRFAEVLRDAAMHARRAAAADQAAAYLDAAAGILQDGWWRSHRGLAFDISYLRCESLLLRGDVGAADVAIGALLTRELRPRDRASTYRLLAGLRTVQSDYEGATAAALSGLDLMGHPLRRSPSLEECLAASERIRSLMGDRPDQTITDLPLADPDIALTTSLLSALIVCVFTGDTMRFLHVAKIVELTITRGVTADSAYGMAWYGVAISDFYGRYQDGFAYGQAALALVDRHGFEGQRTGALVAVDQLSPWTQSFDYALARVHDAIAAGDAAGDLAMTCYARNHLVSDLLQMGRPLVQVEAEAEKGLQLTRRVNFRDIEILITAQRSLARRLRTGEAYEPYENLGDIASVSTQFWVRLYDGIAAYLFDDVDRAAAAFAEAEPLSWSLLAHIDLVYYAFFAALNAARHLPPSEALLAMEPHRRRFGQWARLNRDMFQHKLLLIDAEIARLKGAGLDALRLYDRAILDAGSFVHERALARDLAGRHCEEQGLEGLARRYFQDAAVDYRLWGAEAKAQRMPWLGVETEERASERELLQTMRTVREITKETDPEPLRVQVLHALISHADADRGKLLLVHDGDLIIEADGYRTAEGIKVSVGTMMPTPDRVEPDVLASILQTSEPILKDVLTRSDDPVASNGLRSIIGLPLLSAERLVGVVYLEANPERSDRRLRRLPILRLLTDQAAISLERAQWHARTYENYERRAQAENALRAARAELAHTSYLATIGGLAASIAHEINQPLSSIVTYASAGTRWLKRIEPDLNEVLHSLDAIESAGLRAAEIVASLRSLAKQDNIQRELLDLNVVIRDVLELTRPEIEARRVRLVADISQGECVVSADRVQLQQLVLNLVNNAMDAMSDTAIDNRLLLVSCTEREEQFVTRVEDRGCGIPAGSLTKIFDPLFSTKSKGMGMGLAICKSIIEAHGGQLGAGEGSAGGTYFEFILPAGGAA